VKHYPRVKLESAMASRENGSRSADGRKVRTPGGNHGERRRPDESGCGVAFADSGGRQVGNIGGLTHDSGGEGSGANRFGRCHRVLVSTKLVTYI